MRLWILERNNLIVLAIFTFALYVYFNCTLDDIIHFKRMIAGDDRVTNTTKKILFWNTMFDDENFYMGKGDIFVDCPVNDCYATHERGYANLTEFDAVLFHGNELKLADLPLRRSPRQWYVFVNLESPANRPLSDHFYEDFFNATMTYRLDSDIVWTYGIVKDVHNGQTVAPDRDARWEAFYNRAAGNQSHGSEDASSSKMFRRKVRPIIWFVSNCQAKSGRQEYVDELSRHIPIDVYGKCGTMYCPPSVDCFKQVVEPHYFFYLSFENSFCDDYVTEKLYNALRYNVIPIVYGGANYSLFAPPRSYIDAFDFDSSKDLAEYLKRLIKDPREYNKYFAWKRYYKIDGGIQRAACNLCEFLHKRKEPRMYNSLSNWYSQQKCPLQEFLRYHSYLTGSVLKD